MDVKLIKDINDIKLQWEKLLLESETGTVFQTPNWVSVWMSHANEELRIENGKLWTTILGVYEGNQLIGVGVFEEREDKIIFGAMRPRWSSAYALADFGDVVAKRWREEEIWREILMYLSTQHSALSIQLDFIRETSPSFAILKSRGNVEKQEVSPIINIPRSWSGYTDLLPRKKRHELTRKMRQIEKLEPQFLVKNSVDEKDIGRLIELVKTASPVKSKFMNVDMELFFHRMMVEMFAAGWGRLFALEVDGVAEAMVLGFEFRDSWYLYNGGYNPELKSVGIALSGKIIQAAIERGIGKVDFLRGDERYKYDLGAYNQQLYQIVIDRI